MENSIRIVRCSNLDVMASIEYYNNESHSSYYPYNILFLIKRGTLNLKVKSNVYSYGKGTNVLVKRFTEGLYFKTFTKEEGRAEVYAIAFHDELLKSITDKISKKGDEVMDESEIPIIEEIKPHHNLNEIKKYLDQVFGSEEKLNEDVMQQHISNSLQHILEVNPKIYSIFRRLFKTTKADLSEFMEHHYKNQVHLKELAKLSGRSLATFYRDFNAFFGTSPHQWILNRRLEEAHRLLLQNGITSNMIYLNLGFKDLSHFSRVFKRKYGVSPSRVGRK